MAKHFKKGDKVRCTLGKKVYEGTVLGHRRGITGWECIVDLGKNESGQCMSLTCDDKDLELIPVVKKKVPWTAEGLLRAGAFWAMVEGKACSAQIFPACIEHYSGRTGLDYWFNEPECLKLYNYKNEEIPAYMEIEVKTCECCGKEL